MTRHIKLLFFLAVSLPSFSWTKSESTKNELRRLIEEYIADHSFDKECASLREDVSFLANENLILKQALSKMNSVLNDMKSRVDDIMTENRELKEHMIRMDREMSHFRDTGHVTEHINGYRNNSERSDRNYEHRGKSNILKRLSNGYTNTGIVASSPIAFTAWISANIVNPTDRQIFVYDHIITNSGNAYNKNNGIFTSPIRGIYAFYGSILTAAGKYLEAEIVKNGNAFCRLYSGDMDFWAPGFNMAVIELSVGDAVWVRINGIYHDAGVFVDSRFTSFSGFLLYETE